LHALTKLFRRMQPTSLNSTWAESLSEKRERYARQEDDC
jgi:hypothetical protein